MSDAPPQHDPFADIATPETLTLWLDDLGLERLVSPLIERGLWGQALLDADPKLLGAIAGDSLAKLRRWLDPLRRLRLALAPALTQAELDDEAEHCRALGRDWQAQPWLAELVATWPGPIAHEVGMLGPLLERGHAVGVLWQLRDVAEVLIKVPAIILARDLLDHGGSPEIRQDIRGTFFHTELSMGTWMGLARELSRAVMQGAGSGLVAPGLARLFWQTPKKPSPYQQALNHLVTLRNDLLGHGATRFDASEVTDTLRHYLIGGLDARLRKALNLPEVTTLAEGLDYAHGLNPWANLTLEVDGPGGRRPLIGAEGQEAHHRGAAPGAGHTQDPAPLFLVSRAGDPGDAALDGSGDGPGDGRVLPLGPYLTARVCALCNYRDVFLFNGWDRDRGRFDLLDYQIGHRMRQPWHCAPDLHLASMEQCDDPAPGFGTDGGERPSLTNASIVALLDDTALDRRYLSPGYLRQPLRDFLARERRGIFWLQAPGHLGKSLFVQGLDPLGGFENQDPLPENLKVAAVYIRREYRYGHVQLLHQLERAIKDPRVLDLAEPAYERLQIDDKAADPPAAFLGFIAECMRLTRHRGRLLIALDGLDELRPPERHRSALDFIPAPATLPDGVYLLLSSRPLDDAQACPSWLGPRLVPRLGESVRVHRVDQDDPGYVQLLRDYLERETAGARARLESDALAAGLDPKTARSEARRHFDERFPLLVERSNGLFLYFAFLIDRILERDLPLDALAGQPGQAQLYTDFLERLKDDLAPKQAELGRTLLLALAALEKANDWYIEGRVEPHPVDPDWRGVPLEALADLIQHPGVDGELLYVLLRLKSVLGAWRGESADNSRYRLGLKDLATVIKDHPEWGPALRDTHRRLAEDALALVSRDGAEPPGGAATGTRPDPWRLRYALAHGNLSGDAGLAGRIAGDQGLFSRIIDEGNAAYYTHRLTESIRWRTLALHQAEAMQGCGDPLWSNLLAAAYIIRGNAKQDATGHGPGAAIADYDAAIALMDDLRRLLEPDGRWEAALRNDLAGAYTNRGNAKQGATGHGPGAAIADYDSAIALMEDLRRLLEPEGRWGAGLRNDLATAYTGRGNAKQGATGHGPGAAIADYDAAIALREDLRRLLEPEGRWEARLRNDLATAYSNRGVAKQGATGHGPGAAIADYDAAIVLREDLRQLLEPEGRWEAGLRNGLAQAYTNRGNAKQHATGHGPGAAIADYDSAIALGEDLRQLLEPDGCWEAELRDGLAKAYANRGVAKQHATGHGPGAAIADCDAAIALREDLRRLLEPKGRWEAGLRNGLAQAYINRGNAKQGATGHGPGAAIADYESAIALMDDLRRLLEPDGRWEGGLPNDLAKAYMNRGNSKAQTTGHGPGAAIADYDSAIALMEDLRQLLEPAGRWEAGLCNDLALAYLNLGLARKQSGDPAGAVADWGECANLFAELVECGWLASAVHLLRALAWLLVGCRDLADWPSAAGTMWRFSESSQRLQAAWESGGWDGEPPWMDEVRGFAAAVQGLDPEQRAALLAALGEQALPVCQAFGWDPPQGP